MGVLGPRTLDEYELFVEEETETEFGKDTRYAEFLWNLYQGYSSEVVEDTYQGYSSEVVEDTFDPPRALHQDFLSKVMNSLDPTPNTLGLAIILAMVLVLAGMILLEGTALFILSPIILGVVSVLFLLSVVLPFLFPIGIVILLGAAITPIVHLTLLLGILIGGVAGAYLQSTDLLSANIIEGASLGYTLALLILLIGPILLVGLLGGTFWAVIGAFLGAVAGLSAAYPSDRSGLLRSALAGAILGGIAVGIGGGLLESAALIVLFGGIWALFVLGTTFIPAILSVLTGSAIFIAIGLLKRIIP
jgi:hypothetical protein